MTDFVSFNEGRQLIATSGLPATCWFLLSTKPCSQHRMADTLVSVGEIAGTGYERQAALEPAATLANPSVVRFDTSEWETGQAEDWPAVRSVVMCSSADNTGRAVCAWNLLPGGFAREMRSNTTELFTPTLTFA